MNIALDPKSERFIAERVGSGRYASPEDVVRAGFASLQQQEHVASMPTAELEAIYPGFRQKIAEGLEDENAGRLSDGDAFFAELECEEQEDE